MPRVILSGLMQAIKHAQGDCTVKRININKKVLLQCLRTKLNSIEATSIKAVFSPIFQTGLFGHVKAELSMVTTVGLCTTAHTLPTVYII